MLNLSEAPPNMTQRLMSFFLLPLHHPEMHAQIQLRCCLACVITCDVFSNKSHKVWEKYFLILEGVKWRSVDFGWPCIRACRDKACVSAQTETGVASLVRGRLKHHTAGLHHGCKRNSTKAMTMMFHS